MSPQTPIDLYEHVDRWDGWFGILTLSESLRLLHGVE